jgi:hypothetical protein
MQTRENEIETMRQFYEQRLADMQSRIKSLTEERDRIMRDMESHDRSHTQEQRADAQSALAERLRETELQLHSMREKQRDLERVAAVRAKMNAEVCEAPSAVASSLPLSLSPMLLPFVPPEASRHVPSTCDTCGTCTCGWRVHACRSRSCSSPSRS